MVMMPEDLLKRQVRTADEPESAYIHEYYDKSWALVIGINDYKEGFNRLNNARNDAEAIADVLKNTFRFDQVITLLDSQATREAIIEWLRDELPSKVGFNDRLIIFFAGHGTTQKMPGTREVRVGYLIPQDARPQKYSDNIDMEELRRACGLIPAKHIFIILDCCFSGVAAVMARGSLPLQEEIRNSEIVKSFTEKSAWQILTAGDVDEQVADSGLRPGHSAFTSAVLDGLDGGADLDGDLIITASDLISHVKKRVISETKREGARGQAPIGNYMVGGDLGGEFVFLLRDKRKEKRALSEIKPYKGLEPFTETDANIFFGRRNDVDKLLINLQSIPRFLGVVGPSGIGKTSLIQAGLLPRLRRGAVPGSDRWGFIIARPGNRPFENLEASGLKGASNGLVRASGNWLSAQKETNRLVLILDQFDEFLMSCPQHDRTKLWTELADLLEAHQLSITVIVILRDIFLSRFIQEAPSSRSEWQRQSFLGISYKLDKDELQEIIREPARQAGMEIEEGLLQVIMDDFLEASGERERTASASVLPLLGASLNHLWELGSADAVLTHRDYVEIGKQSGDMPEWADKAYEKLSLDGLGPLARRVLVDLVNLGDKGENIPDSGRRMTMDSLCYDEKEENAVLRVVQRLADARLVATSLDEEAGQEIVKIINNALIQKWEVLKQWLDKDRIFLEWRRAIEKNARAWINIRSGDDLSKIEDLLRSQNLLESEGWLNKKGEELSQREKEYINAGLKLKERDREEKEKAREEKARTTRRIFFILVITAALAVLVLEERNYANEKTQEALARTLASQSELIIGDSPTSLAKSTLLAVESLNHWESPDGYTALRRELALLPRSIKRLDHNDFVNDVAFSPDGWKLATASEDGNASIWDTRTWRRQNLVHGGPVHDVVFSKDGSKLATASDDGTARIWNASTGEELQKLWHKGVNNETSYVNAVAFSPDGKMFATASDDGTALIRNASTGEQLEKLQHEGSVNAMVFSPDGSKLATASDDGTARIWNASTGEQLHELWHEGSVNAVAFSPDRPELATASKDGTARIWDINKNTELQKLKHNGAVLAVIFSREGDKLATASDDRTARIWDVATGAELSRMIHDESVLSLAFSPDESRLATSSSDNSTQIWDLNMTEPWEPMHNYIVNGATFNMNGSKLAVAGEGGNAIIWDTRTWTQQNLAAYKAIRYMVFSPDGSKLATASKDGTCRIWDVATGTPLQNLSHNYTIAGIALSPDGAKLATASDNGTAQIWDVATGKQLRMLNLSVKLNDVSFSPDGFLLATASNNGTAVIWDARTGERLRGLHQGSIVYALTFSPDSTELATGSKDGIVRIWDVKTGILLQRLEHDGYIRTLSFSQDGTKLITVSSDRKLRVWQLNITSLIEEACNRITSNMTREEWIGFMAESDCLTCPREGSFNKSSILPWDDRKCLPCIQD